MSGLEKHLEKEKKQQIFNATETISKNKGVRRDIDDEDDEESYYR